MIAINSITITSLIVLVISISCSTVNGLKAKTDSSEDRCTVQTNGTVVIKSIGDTWNSTNPCVKYVCEVGPDGLATPKEFKEYCYVTCDNEYEVVIPEGHCCGQCVQAKCRSYNKYYSIGETWKSSDKCEIMECIGLNGRPEIIAYKKSCPKLTDCPPEYTYSDECCKYCKKPVKGHKYEPIPVGDPHSDDDPYGYMNAETYQNHPCARECHENEAPMTCKYNFIVEWYETLSKACYDCPYNVTDCLRPHCIAADGIGRSVLVVNRMMPGPQIEVCHGDKMIVDVKNSLLGEGTTIHWHGLHQRENPYMDGVPHISQCAIPPHSMFRYEFTADNSGTHFWHSHIGMQRGDGAFGALIIKLPVESDQNSNYYDYDIPKEHTIIVQDWAHIPGVSMFASHHHSDGDNKPPNILINGKGRYFEKGVKRGPLIVPVDQSKLFPLIESTTMDSTPPVTTTIQEDETTTIIDETTTEIEEPTTNQATQIDDKIVLTPSVQMLPSHHRREKRRVSTVTDESRMVPLHVFTVTAGKRFRFRLINAEFLNCPMELSIDSHYVTVIASDGYDLVPKEFSSFVNYAGERFDFVLNANQLIGNYWIRLKGLMDCGPQFTQAFQVAILRYVGADEVEPSQMLSYDDVREGLQLNSLNKGGGHNETVTIAEMTAAYPDDPILLREKPDFKFYIYYDFYGKDNPHFHVPNLYGFKEVPKKHGKLYTPQLNHISMKMPSIPLMPQKEMLDDNMFCNSSTLTDQGKNCKEEYCECSHVLQIPLGAVVEMVLIDEGFTFDANHPFHLHGHSFRVVGMERLQKEIPVEDVKKLDESGMLRRKLRGAPKKDTVTIPDGGYTIIRFVADNPGYWLFHCHIEFHAEIGMALVLKIGEHHEMKPTPKNFPTCSDYIPSGYEQNGGSTTLITTWLWSFSLFILYSNL